MVHKTTYFDYHLLQTHTSVADAPSGSMELLYSRLHWARISVPDGLVFIAGGKGVYVYKPVVGATQAFLNSGDLF